MTTSEQYSSAIQVEDMITERLDGELFEYSKSARCKVCNAPTEIARMVDSMLVQPYTFTAIIGLIDPIQDKMHIPDKDRIKYSSLMNHRRNHMPFEKIAVRLLLEEKARQRGKKILQGVDSILTADAFYTRIADKTWDLLNEGRLSPSIAEGLKAMQMKHELEAEESGNAEFTVLMTQFNILVTAIKKYCSPDQVQQIVHDIEQIRNASVAGELKEVIEDAIVVEDYEKEE